LTNIVVAPGDEVSTAGSPFLKMRFGTREDGTEFARSQSPAVDGGDVLVAASGSSNIEGGPKLEMFAVEIRVNPSEARVTTWVVSRHTDLCTYLSALLLAGLLLNAGAGWSWADPHVAPIQ
jgi:hypothetical protein